MFYLLVDVIVVNEKFSKFCGETLAQTGHENDNTLHGSSNKNDKQYETSINMSGKETFFVKGFDNSHCFVLTFPEESLDNKAIVLKNLTVLKDFLYNLLAMAK